MPGAFGRSMASHEPPHATPGTTPAQTQRENAASSAAGPSPKSSPPSARLPPPPALGQPPAASCACSQLRLQPAAAASEALDLLGRLEVDGVRLGRGGLVLAPHLDGLVRLGRHQPRARHVEGGGEDARLAVQRARLDLRRGAAGRRGVGRGGWEGGRQSGRRRQAAKSRRQWQAVGGRRACVSACWKQCPERQSQNQSEPLSPPEASTPSSLSAMQLTMARWLDSALCRNSPCGGGAAVRRVVRRRCGVWCGGGERCGRAWACVYVGAGGGGRCGGRRRVQCAQRAQPRSVPSATPAPAQPPAQRQRQRAAQQRAPRAA